MTKSKCQTGIRSLRTFPKIFLWGLLVVGCWLLLADEAAAYAGASQYGPHMACHNAAPDFEETRQNYDAFNGWGAGAGSLIPGTIMYPVNVEASYLTGSLAGAKKFGICPIIRVTAKDGPGSKITPEEAAGFAQLLSETANSLGGFGECGGVFAELGNEPNYEPDAADPAAYSAALEAFINQASGFEPMLVGLNLFPGAKTVDPVEYLARMDQAILLRLNSFAFHPYISAGSWQGEADYLKTLGLNLDKIFFVETGDNPSKNLNREAQANFLLSQMFPTFKTIAGLKAVTPFTREEPADENSPTLMWVGDKEGTSGYFADFTSPGGGCPGGKAGKKGEGIPVSYGYSRGEPFRDNNPASLSIDQFKSPRLGSFFGFSAAGQTLETDILSNTEQGLTRLTPKKLAGKFELSPTDQELEGQMAYPFCGGLSGVLNFFFKNTLSYRIPVLAPLISRSRVLSSFLKTGPAIVDYDLRVKEPGPTDNFPKPDCGQEAGIQVPFFSQLSNYSISLPAIGLFQRQPVGTFPGGAEAAGNYYQQRSGSKTTAANGKNEPEAGFAASFVPKQVSWYSLEDRGRSTGLVETTIEGQPINHEFVGAGGLNCSFLKFQKMILPKKAGKDLPEECQ